MKPFLKFGPFTFESYTLVTNLGTLLGLTIMYLILEKTCEKEKRYWKLVLAVLALMAVGTPVAKALKGAFGGNATGAETHFLGRVLFAAVVLAFLMKFLWKNRECCYQAWNSVASYFLVQHFFNRIACFLNGCCGGSIQGESNIVFPSQLFEAAMVLIAFGILLWNIKKERWFYCESCMIYAVVIFVSEFFIEQPEIGKIIGMTSIQAGAIALFLLAFFNRNLYKPSSGGEIETTSEGKQK